MTLSEKDLLQLAAKGISVETLEHQLGEFKTGFPFLRLEGPASIGKGIVSPTASEADECKSAWEAYKATGKTVVKFVPASGAASRMFKDMFAFVDAPYDVPTTAFEKQYFDNITRFAFYDALNAVLEKQTGKDIPALIAEGAYKTIARAMLAEDGLNYGQLPKGMLLFHNYAEGARTPMEEHLVEGALYAASGGKAYVHFTVSHEHLPHFKAKVAEKQAVYAEKYGVAFDISFSEQKPSTDTVAANPDGTPFRNADGSLLFRPAGHGALIENLNDINSKVIFIKNIDNVVPTNKRDITLRYKKVIGGYLVLLQKKIAKYVKLLETGTYTIEDMRDMIHFIHDNLNTRYSETKHLDDSELAIYLLKKFNRPIRVCGIVKNDGEPGGGPFIAFNQDGSTSPQILESSQFDKNDAASMEMMKNSTHFNPVDLVCYVYDASGNKFDLPKYVDRETGFISEKSKDGKELKALELPGLWNGSMSDWNTAFVEVPIETFNPVKTVNDLLRPMHQE